MTLASEIASVNLTPLNLRRMFKETGRPPAVIMKMTPAEFVYLFPFASNNKPDDDKVTRMVTAHANVNGERGKKGQPPKLSGEFIGHLESKLNRVNHG